MVAMAPRPSTRRVLFAAATFAVASTFTTATALAQDTTVTAVAHLAPTSDSPWNPAQPMPSSRLWEDVARFPGKVASIPFSLLGQAMKGGLVYAENTDLAPKVASGVSILLDHGIIAGPASLGDRTGWGGEVGINPTFFRRLIAFVSGSTRGYNRERVLVSIPYGLVEYQSDWQSQEAFYGVSGLSRREEVANYAAKSQFARLELHVPERRAAVPVRERLEDPAASTETHDRPRALLRAWTGPRDVILLDGREQTTARQPLSVRFPLLAANQLETRVEHFVYGGELSYDTRTGRPHWWKGWRAAVSAERFDAPLEAFAFHSASTPSIPFTRLTYEGEAGFSFWKDPRTLRFYGRVEDQTNADGPGVFLISDLASLGGQEGLHGYEPGRFHDVDLVLGGVAYIFPIGRYLETDLHTERGEVMHRLEEAQFEDLAISYGVAIRIRNSFAPLMAFGVDWSREKVRWQFKLGGVE